jgi:NAD(P)-dependent dehydrogenase (short-subunit alcohol dehydrogenase family)
MNRLQDKVTIVTGGAHGIGAAIVQRFAEEGAKVISVDVNRDLGEANAKVAGADFIQVDVSNHQAVGEFIEQTAQRYGRLDCIVSNACLHRGYHNVEEQTFDEWEKVIAVNLTATYHLAHFGAKHLRKQAGASIVIVSSVNAIRGFHNASAYATSKGGQMALMRQMATDLAPAIRVNAILPGTIRTYPERMTQEVETVIGKQHLLGRIGEPAEIANGAVFLSSDEASFVTGHGLVMDGGFTSQGLH